MHHKDVMPREYYNVIVSCCNRTARRASSDDATPLPMSFCVTYYSLRSFSAALFVVRVKYRDWLALTFNGSFGDVIIVDSFICPVLTVGHTHTHTHTGRKKKKKKKRNEGTQEQALACHMREGEEMTETEEPFNASLSLLVVLVGLLPSLITYIVRFCNLINTK